MSINRRQFVKTSGLGALTTTLMSRTANAIASTPSEDTSDIHKMSVHQLKQLLLEKKLSSVEIVTAFIKRIDAVNPQLNAVVAFEPDNALKEARLADESIARKKSVGALHGIPCTIKDSFDTAGIISTGGTVGRRNFIPARNATVVQRVKDAGAIILGKTNTPEFTMSFFTDNLVYGKTKNPYDLNRSPGGSSGGAAAIIAAGGSPFDIGSDTGGSIRFPAHCCGIAGIKPTAGRVPRTGHIVDFHGVAESMTHVGPLARHAKDLELLLNVIHGIDHIDPYIYPVSLNSSETVSLNKLRFAFFTDNKLITPSRETIDTIRRVVGILSKQSSVAEHLPDGIQESARLRSYVITGGWMQRMLDQYGSKETSLTWLQDVPDLSSSEYGKVVAQIDNYRSSMLALWNDFDVLVCPVNAHPAPVLDAKVDTATYFSYTVAFNITGWPSVVIRGGTSDTGLPIGIQIVAPPWREDICLAVARHLEQQLGPWKDDVLK